MKVLGIILIFGTIILGILGYLEKILSFELGKITTWICLLAFLLLYLLQIAIDKFKDAKQAEEFYDQELVEAFPHEISQEKLKFFTDKSGNKCVAINLEREPIQKSLKLWEGGYDAPPITLAFDRENKKRVIFINSGYSSYEEYLKRKGPMYQVRYFPKK